jgi:hypothetical protein
LPSVVAAILDRAESDLDYESCPHCHRPSWGYVGWLIEDARRDERAKVALEEWLAGMELSFRARLSIQNEIGRLLQPAQPVGRRFLRVLP